MPRCDFVDPAMRPKHRRCKDDAVFKLANARTDGPYKRSQATFSCHGCLPWLISLETLRNGDLVTTCVTRLAQPRIRR